MTNELPCIHPLEKLKITYISWNITFDEVLTKDVLIRHIDVACSCGMKWHNRYDFTAKSV